MSELSESCGSRERLLHHLRMIQPTFEMQATTCIGCRKCATKCNWKLTNAAELYPHQRVALSNAAIAHAMRPTRARIASKLRLVDAISDSDAELLVREAFEGCTLCGRCSTACTQGVSARAHMRHVREAAVSAGMAPEIFRTMLSNAETFGQTFGRSYEETTGRVIEGTRARGFEMPVDVEGSTYLWVCSSAAFTLDPVGVLNITELLCQSGVSFTSSSKLLETGMEIHTAVQDREMSSIFVQRIISEMKRLNCKTLIVGECACDTRVFFVDYAQTLNEAGIEVIPIGYVLLDAIRKNKLTIKQKFHITATVHDPCWSTRLVGMGDLVREMLEPCIDRIYEWSPNREQNICCNGGAGSMRRYPAISTEFHARRKASELKANQISVAKSMGAQIVTTPCVTCTASLRDTVQWWGEKKGLDGIQVYSSLNVMYHAVKGLPLSLGKEN